MIKQMKKGTHAGKWQVRVQPVDPITGKRLSLPVKYFDTKREAEQVAKQIKAEYEDGLNLSDGKAVFAESFQKYVDQRANSISPVTLKSWQESADSFKQYFKNAKVNQITTPLISQYAHDYVNKHHATVSLQRLLRD